jgi:LysR family hydrogen peroxide-inducible transcriptional activator
VIIAPLPVNQGGLKDAVLFEEPLYLAVPTDHELAERASIKPSDLEGVDLLALGPGHQLRDLVVNLAAECGANLRYDYEGTSLDTLREMMATGLGVSLMPGLYARSVVSKDPRFKTFDIGTRGLSRTIGMIWRKTKSAQHNFDNLAVLIRDLVRGEFGSNRAKTHAEPVA